MQVQKSFMFENGISKIVTSSPPSARHVLNRVNFKAKIIYFCLIGMKWVQRICNNAVIKTFQIHSFIYKGVLWNVTLNYIRHFDENNKPKHVWDEMKGHKLQSPKLALSRSRRSRWLYSYYRYSQLNISLTKENKNTTKKKFDVTPMQFRRFSRDPVRPEQTQPVLWVCNTNPPPTFLCTTYIAPKRRVIQLSSWENR